MSDATPSIDGRSRRRIQGQQAALDAMIDIVLEGETPSAEAICARADISQASLFRYFDTLEELRRTAAARYFERFDDLFSLPDSGEGTRSERIDGLIAARDRLYRRTEPMARFSRHHAVQVDELASTLRRLRATFSDQIAHHFASELRTTGTDVAARTVATIAVLTSFESWDQLAPLGAAGRRAAMNDAVTALLERVG